MKSGCEAGSTERIETGCSVERAIIARNMKTKDCSVEVIAECTGLTEKILKYFITDRGSVREERNRC